MGAPAAVPTPLRTPRATALHAPGRSGAAIRWALLLAIALVWGAVAGAQGLPPLPSPPGPQRAVEQVRPTLPAGYRLLEARYRLRAPDGRIVLWTVRDEAPGGGTARWDTPAHWDDPAPQPAQWTQGWLGQWLLRTPRAYEQLSDYVQASWAVIVRLLDYLGVAVLLSGAWVLWFLVRPALIGLSDRQAFLLVFAVLCALWAYATELYASVVYALGLLLLPALVLGLAGLLVRRLWAHFTVPPAGGS